MGWLSDKCAVCGEEVPKKARICSNCGTRAPGGWIRCPNCGEWVGNESNFCPHCNHPMHPAERIDLAGGVWSRDPATFAQRFECGDLSHLKRSGLYVQEGSRAILMDGGKQVAVLGPGRHTPEGLARAINWFGNPPPRSVVMVDSGDICVKCTFPPADADVKASSLRTKEEHPVTVVSEIVLRFVPRGADDFLENMMKDSRSVGVDEIVALVYDEALPAVKSLCSETSVEDLVKDPSRRIKLESVIAKASSVALGRCGLEFVRVGAADFVCAAYEEMREKYAELDQRRRNVEFEKKVLDLIAQQDINSEAAEDERTVRGQEREKAGAAREKELHEYLERLAAEQKVGDIERNNAIEVALKVARGELDRKDAELERATRLEQYAKDLEEQAHLQKLDLNTRNYGREQALADARHNSELAAIVREERVKDAKTDTVVKGELVAQEKLDAEIRRIRSDAQKYEDMNDLDVLDRKNKAEGVALAERAKTLAGKSPLEMIALATTDAERQMYLQLALNEQAAVAQKSQSEHERQMTPEQLLARAAASSPEAAKALAAMAEAKSGSAERVIGEMKEMFDKREAHDNSVMEQVVKIVTESVKHQSTVVQAQPSQVFNK